VVAIDGDAMELPRDRTQSRERVGDEPRVRRLAADRLVAPGQMDRQVVAPEREIGGRVLGEPCRAAPLEERARLGGGERRQLIPAA